MNKIILIDKFNNIIINNTINKTITFNSTILHHKNLLNDEYIIDKEFLNVRKYFLFLINDLLIIKLYLMNCTKRKGRSLFISEGFKNVFYETFFNCLNEEYDLKIDFITN